MKYRWARHYANPDPVEVTVSQGFDFEADCFDDMVDKNADHSFCKIEFNDHASVAEGGQGAAHVKAPVVGFPLAPGKWSTTDPHADPAV
jgi:hypothetical protein